jgi:hypothetical protein
VLGGEGGAGDTRGLHQRPVRPQIWVGAAGVSSAEVHRFEDSFDGKLQVSGNHRLVQELIEGDFVDQINLMVFPEILGTG